MAAETEQLTFPASLEGWWYTDPAIFAAEQRTIYGGRWVCVGRGDDITAPGSFIVREVGGESIIVLRTEEGAAAAYYNVCRHRGARLLTEPDGVCKGVIRCPYHAWAYGLDGALRAAPNMPDWRRERWQNLSLHPSRSRSASAACGSTWPTSRARGTTTSAARSAAAWARTS